MTKSQLLQNAKPILFNTDMVRAIQNNGKSVTRRVIKPQPTNHPAIGIVADGDNFYEYHLNNNGFKSYDRLIKPKYKVGDIRYVGETWREHSPIGGFIYRSNYTDGMTAHLIRWKSSSDMPKEAARFFLKITDVRVERLKDITYEQVIKEGLEGGIKCDCHSGCEECLYTGRAYPANYEFALLWNSTIKKQDLDQYGWEANPWVWVYEFERIKYEL